MTLTVLWSTGPLKSDDNPYLHQLAEGLGEHVSVVPLSGRAALRTTPDVFHVHWPHQLYRASGQAKTLVKTVLTTVLLRRLRARRVPVVLTVHNRASHEREGRVERRILAALERLVTLRIYLNESSENDLGGGVVLLHPDYRAWLARHGALPASRQPERDVILFGMLRPYKGIETLIEAADAAGASLTVAGRALDPAYAEALVRLAAESPEVLLDQRHLKDAELVDTILGHRLVCLPYPEMYNSGALLYALSVGRQVLAPRSPANEAIAREIGGDWLRLYDGPLTGDVVKDALQHPPTTDAPDLSRRDWPTHVALHRSLYETLAAQRPTASDARAAVIVDSAFLEHSALNAPLDRGQTL